VGSLTIIFSSLPSHKRAELSRPERGNQWQVGRISGEIIPNFKKALKIAQIDGEIPTIDSKNRKMGIFAPLNRKFSAYLHPYIPY
jgi:hypothetical protein